MRTLVTKEKRIEEITLDNIKNGEVTLMQLNEIYDKMGFVFIADSGKFTGIRRESRRKRREKKIEKETGRRKASKEVIFPQRPHGREQKSGVEESCGGQE